MTTFLAPFITLKVSEVKLRLSIFSILISYLSRIDFTAVKIPNQVKTVMQIVSI